MRSRPKGSGEDFSQGVAITSSWHPDEVTHIEPVRYGKGSNAMSLMQTVLTDGDGPDPRWKTWLKELWKEKSQRPRPLRRQALVRAGGHRAGDADGGQLDHDQAGEDPVRLVPRRPEQGHGDAQPDLDPRRQRGGPADGGRTWAAKPGGTIGEPFNMPLTAHFIGGCTIGDSPESGVVDPYQRIYGYDGLHIADGSAISANLGVNPSLTITAQAERAMAFWPNKGEMDPRPAAGASYQRIQPVAPKQPVVPDDAPGALRLPIVGVS